MAAQPTPLDPATSTAYAAQLADPVPWRLHHQQQLRAALPQRLLPPQPSSRSREGRMRGGSAAQPTKVPPTSQWPCRLAMRRPPPPGLAATPTSGGGPPIPVPMNASLPAITVAP
jgi:hypothetical protein